MRRLFCAFVVRKQQSWDFLRRGHEGIEAQAPWPALLRIRVILMKRPITLKSCKSQTPKPKLNDFLKPRIVIQSASRHYPIVYNVKLYIIKTNPNIC